MVFRAKREVKVVVLRYGSLWTEPSLSSSLAPHNNATVSGFGSLAGISQVGRTIRTL